MFKRIKRDIRIYIYDIVYEALREFEKKKKLSDLIPEVWGKMD